MTTGDLIDAITNDIAIYDLGRSLANGIPQSSDHPQFRLSVSRRHGDIVRADGSTGANETLFASGHVGTHVDALSHISYDGLLHGGVRIEDAMEGGRFVAHGAEEIPVMLCRGVLLDIPKVRGVDRLDGDDEVTVVDLENALEAAGGLIDEGDVVLVRTGWGAMFGDRELFEGGESGAPGPGVFGARGSPHTDRAQWDPTRSPSNMSAPHRRADSRCTRS